MTLEDSIESALGGGVETKAALSGGCIGEVYRLHLTDGRDVVAKIDSGGMPRLDVEGYMLEYLAEHSQLPVPEVLYASPSLLIMNHLLGESHFDGSAQEHAAELLSTLHSVHAPSFGLERDTLIGGLPQSNRQANSWIDFFRSERLLNMGNQAITAKRMGENTLRRLESFSDHLDEWLLEPEHPSLLHGDVWTTNVLAKGGRITGFIDPAIYYGHPEIELAFITLFNTFSERFFDTYQQLAGIAPGFFEERRDIYNLYPLLVHVRLFGGGYLASVENTLSRYGY